MGEYEGDRLSLTYHAIAHPTRRAILHRLRAGPARVTELAEPFDVSLNTISKHVRRLEEAGLVSREVVGREHVLRARTGPLEQASSWIDDYCEFWENRIDALEEHLRRSARGGGGGDGE